MCRGDGPVVGSAGADTGLEFSDPGLRPWPGFAVAAEAAVRQLSDAVRMDLWLVTHVEGDRQLVVAAAGGWAGLAPAGAGFAWAESFCLPMVTGRGPMVAPDVRSVGAYAGVTSGLYARVRAYLGVPLIVGEGRVFGTVCGFAGAPKSPALAGSLSLVRFVSRMIGTILAGEQHTHDRSVEAAMAYALAERDQLTGLRNRRGWESTLGREDGRCRRYGPAATVLVVSLDAPRHEPAADPGAPAADAAVLAECAAVLQAACRPADLLARLGGGEFRVLAVECDAPAAAALVCRLRRQLRSAGVQAAVGAATRRAKEDLAATSRRAEQVTWRSSPRPATAADGISG